MLRQDDPRYVDPNAERCHTCGAGAETSEGYCEPCQEREDDNQRAEAWHDAELEDRERGT